MYFPPSASQMTLVFSPTLYIAAFYGLLPHQPSSTRFVQSRETLSAIHCTLVTSLSALLLYKRRADWLPPPNGVPPSNLTSDNPIVIARSGFANALTALETAYLLADTGILVQGARLRAQERGTRVTSQLNLRLLGWHHGGLLGAFGLLQWYIAKGREKAMLVVVMLLLMNASSPIGTLHWYLTTFCARRRKLVVGSYAMYLVTYAICRVYIVYWILGIFGSHINCTPAETFAKLRLPCQLGTATIGATNAMWLVRGLRKFVMQYMLESGPAKKRL